MKNYSMDRLRQTVIILLLLTLIAMLPTVLLVEVNKDAEQFFNLLLGWFVAKGGDAVAFLLNSTERSNQKDVALANATARAADISASRLSDRDEGTTLHVEPPAKVTIEGAPNAQNAHAGDGPRPAATPADFKEPAPGER